MTERHLHFDSVGGASGDMILAALIDLGVKTDQLQRAVDSLDIDNPRIAAEPVAPSGFRGIRVTVRTHDAPEATHRHLPDIRQLLETAGLPERAAAMSLRVFERLADAEARVHGTTPDRIHFHEVGAVDSIIDVVGSCLALHLLEVDTVTCSPLPLGTGTTTCAHGVVPVPVPATVELLKGRAVVQTGEPHELVTPTGAALLTSWQDMLQPGGRGSQDAAPAGPALHTRSRPSRILLDAGCGVGHQDLDNRPNLLRASLFSTPAAEAPPGDTCLVLECNLDDTIPELVGALCTRLTAEGVLDVYTTPVQMKKQRPGVVLTVLCRETQRDAILEAIFLETTTFGIREHAVERVTLDRRHLTIETPYGSVGIKVGSWHGRDITHSPEHEDCARCARHNGVSVRTVYEAALRAARETS